MGIPSWANATFSADLPRYCENGEGPALEFKRDLPAQLHELGKDIAALASAGGGWIILGVADDGTLVGLGLADAADRDACRRRVQGVLSTVKPQVTAELCFGIAHDKTVLGLNIFKQAEPVFYYDGRPYVRDVSISRPASPDEVKNLVWTHPSAEQQKAMEAVNRRWAEMIQNDSQRHADLMAESLRAGTRALLGQ